MLPESALERLRACREELRHQTPSNAGPTDRQHARHQWQSAWRAREPHERSGDRMFSFYIRNRDRLPTDWQGRKVSDPWLEVRDWLREANRADMLQVKVAPAPATAPDSEPDSDVH